MASFRFQAAVKGRISQHMKAEERAGARAITGAMKDATHGLRDDLRAGLKAAGIKHGSKMLGGFVTPKGKPSLNARGVVKSVVFSNRNPDAPADPLTIYGEGARAIPVHGKFLFIPRATAGDRDQITDWPKEQIEVVLPRNGHAGRILLKGTRIVLFWIVTEAMRRSILNLDSALAKRSGTLDVLAAQRWEVESAKAGVDAEL